MEYLAIRIVFAFSNSAPPLRNFSENSLKIKVQLTGPPQKSALQVAAAAGHVSVMEVLWHTHDDDFSVMDHWFTHIYEYDKWDGGLGAGEEGESKLCWDGRLGMESPPWSENDQHCQADTDVDEDHGGDDIDGEDVDHGGDGWGCGADDGDDPPPMVMLM